MTPLRLPPTEAEDSRVVLCEACGSEGRIIRDGGVILTHCGLEPVEIDCGPCPWCEGTGRELIMTEPIEMEDLDAMAGAPLAHTDEELLACAVQWRKSLKRAYPFDEETMLAELHSICCRLCDGDETKGAVLATRAIWSPT